MTSNNQRFITKLSISVVNPDPHQTERLDPDPDRPRSSRADRRRRPQVSGFRGAGNNSLLSRENVYLFLRRGIITSVSNTTEDVSDQIDRLDPDPDADQHQFADEAKMYGI